MSEVIQRAEKWLPCLHSWCFLVYRYCYLWYGLCNGCFPFLGADYYSYVNVGPEEHSIFFFNNGNRKLCFSCHCREECRCFLWITLENSLEGSSLVTTGSLTLVHSEGTNSTDRERTKVKPELLWICLLRIYKIFDESSVESSLKKFLPPSWWSGSSTCCRGSKICFWKW